MKLSLAGGSLVLFAISLVSLLLLTAFERMLAGISTQTERIITFLLLVLLPAVGAVLGALSLRRREVSAWLAGTSTLLNVLFALFHFFIVLFAG